MTAPELAARRPGLRSRHLLMLLGICVVLRGVSLVRPCLSDDEAIYSVVAREMLSGHVLYRDVVDHKPPLIYLTYAATEAIAGSRGGMILLHGVTILVVFLTALLLADIARRFDTEESAPVFAALLYVVFTTTLLDFDALAANCELFMMLPLAAGAALYLRGAQQARPGLLLATGALVGVSMLYKYQGGVQLPLYAIHLAVLTRRRPGRLLLGWISLAVGLGAVLVVAAATMRQTGAWAAAWFWFRFNMAYIKEGLNPVEVATRAAVRLSFVVVSALLLWAFGVRAAFQALLRRTSSVDDPLRFEQYLAGWLVVSILATTVGGRFFGHYFHQVTAPLALLAAPAAAKMWRSRRRTFIAALGGPAVSFLLMGVFHARVMAAAGEPDPDYARMAEFVAQHSKPSDGLVIWGNSPVLYFEADRPLGSRFVFSNYLTGLSPATRTQSDPTADASKNVVPESWDMFESDLATRRPRIFVDASPGNVGGYGKFPPARFPRLREILERDYQPVGEIAGTRVFERRASMEQAEHAD